MLPARVSRRKWAACGKSTPPAVASLWRYLSDQAAKSAFRQGRGRKWASPPAVSQQARRARARCRSPERLPQRALVACRRKRDGGAVPGFHPAALLPRRPLPLLADTYSDDPADGVGIENVITERRVEERRFLVQDIA